MENPSEIAPLRGISRDRWKILSFALLEDRLAMLLRMTLVSFLPSLEKRELEGDFIYSKYFQQGG